MSMTREDIENTNDQENNSSSHIWANFVGPSEYIDNKLSRISMKNGKTIYELAHPFGDDDEFYEVEKTVYDEFIQKQKIARDKERQLYKKNQTHNKKLQEVWYIPNNETRWGDTAYESRLLDILENKNLKNIKQIEEYIEEWTEENQIQLFQTLAKKEKSPDFYEKSIIEFLDTHESIVEKIFINEDEITHIGQLFVIWYVDDVQLFYRFEELKRANRMNYYKRLYLFWKDEQDSEWTLEKKEFLQDKEMWYILFFLEHKGWTIHDLDDDENRFRNKVQTSYIHELKEFRLGRWTALFWSKYSGFEQKKLTRTLWYTDKDFTNWTEQAEKEFVNDFVQMISNIHIDSIPFLLSLTKLQENIARIWQFTDTNNLKNIISIWLKTCIAQWIQKILNKEKLATCTWNERKNLSYKKWIKNMSEYIDLLYTELEKLDSDGAQTTWRKEKKESYIQEYCDFHKDSFIQKKLLEVLKVDINDKETLEAQLLHDVEAYFYASCKKKIEKRWSDITPYNPLSTRMVIGFMINAFFRTWYALVIKTICPDDKERKTLRQKYVQTITKNILSDINTRLANISTFSLTEYYMREPMAYLYHKYWWQENLLTTQHNIETTYQQYLEVIFEKKWADLIEKIKKNFSSENVLDIKTTYNSIIGFNMFIEKHIWAMIKKHTATSTYANLEESLQQNKSYNEENNNIYPDWLIDDFSFHWHILKNIEKHLSQTILTQCIDWYTTIDALKPQVLQAILQWRFTKNSQVGWKLQRLSQEVIIKNFGILTLSKEQIDFLLQYFTEHLDKIILNDLALNTDWINLFWNDKELIQQYIQQYMVNFKQHFIWLSNNKLLT